MKSAVFFMVQTVHDVAQTQIVQDAVPVGIDKQQTDRVEKERGKEQRNVHDNGKHCQDDLVSETHDRR